jgi:hypothetical protein
VADVPEAYLAKMIFILASAGKATTFLLKSAPCWTHHCKTAISSSVIGVFPLGGM